MREHDLAIEDPFVIEEYAYPRETAEGFCVFHNLKTRKCLIHHVKPETCVAGPITFDIDTNNGKITWFIKKAQICPLAGVVYRDKELLQKHVKAAKREITRLVNGLEAGELAAILLKEEPETFKIAEDNVDTSVLDALRTCPHKR
jgi:Fe-S-cluster containining protein